MSFSVRLICTAAAFRGDQRNPLGLRDSFERASTGDALKMRYVAQLKFRDRERYNRYQSRFADIFRKFRGRLVAADEDRA